MINISYQKSSATYILSILYYTETKPTLQSPTEVCVVLQSTSTTTLYLLGVTYDRSTHFSSNAYVHLAADIISINTTDVLYPCISFT